MIGKVFVAYFSGMLSRTHLPISFISNSRNRRATFRGQAVVEFALVLPVFLMLTLGVVDMARVFTSYISLTNGVSSGAIYAAQGGYLKWCATGGIIACPAGAPATVKIANPDNIAYQIQVDSVGMNQAGIAFASPTCNLTGTATTQTCTATGAGVYDRVTVTATYDMTLLTPLMTVLMGGPVHLTAATTAVIQ